MLKTEYDRLIAPKLVAIRGVMLENRTPRTLIYGYTADRNTFHIYLDADGMLHRVIYDGDEFLLDHADESRLIPLDFVPDKRVYPECCDLEFCRMLMHTGVDIPFTGYNENDIPEGPFVGSRKSELIQASPADHLAPISISTEELGLRLDLGLYEAGPALGTVVSEAIREMLDRPYRRAKYKDDAENLKLWLRNLPTNVEWTVQNWLKKALPYADESSKYEMPKDAARSLIEKVSKAVRQQLNEPAPAA